MASDQLKTGLLYLTDAAHLLRQTAPETSAHLMRQRDDLMFHNKLAQHELQRQHVCGACGHIMIPGDGSSLKLRPQPRLRNRRRKQVAQASQAASRKDQETPKSTTTGPAKIISCGHCKRVTEISLPAPETAMRRKALRASADKKMAPTVSQKPKLTANANSKKRAKNRKGGLQALLSGQQQRPTNSLSLADFMG
jgi:hypothetical protein